MADDGGRPPVSTAAGRWAVANYRPRWFATYLALLGSIARADAERPPTESEVREALADRRWRPETDLWLACPLTVGASDRPAAASAQPGGSAAAAGGATYAGWTGLVVHGEAETGEPGVRAVLRGGVVPSWRCRGLGGFLLDLALAVAKARWGPRLDSALVRVNGERPERGRFLEARGFRRAWVAREMRWLPNSPVGDSPDASPVLPSGYVVERVPVGAGPAVLAALYNTAFAGRPNFVPSTAEDVASNMGGPGYVPEGNLWVRLGPAVVGFSTSLLTADGQGTLETVAILREHRGRGLGACLALRSAEALAARGARSVSLSVVGDNEAALRAYGKAGFAVTACRATYSRRLAPKRPARPTGPPAAGGR